MVKNGRKREEGGPARIDRSLVVWDDKGLAFHARSGLPITGEVVRGDGSGSTEGRYVDGVRQGFGHRYSSPEGRALARREADEQVRITTRPLARRRWPVALGGWWLDPGVLRLRARRRQRLRPGAVAAVGQAAVDRAR